MAPGPFPVQQAEQELGLKTLGPPWPPPDLTPDQWIAGLASLPLLDQPGSRWRYNTGASVAGVLIALVSTADDLYALDRKSTRLNSSHPSISYAVFCLKKKK